ncbi:MerR family DNA-binding transcriptional regulator [Anaerobacillus alkaliphilus]|uniref:MerR family DNA-binding transcriptional regulator n=1 Tax=Anaerobacillus alkaliphilus TaxID=1548597 RepID=A0A4Q0VWJ1_9BACI|nr:MerR family DNA-binding transcriptional regulator [Anaerobacillus alkaliphilus]RXJ04004.1 MerR family DNA-binding transcriptional regulator [Anaerobacillus alkaliphilus]
METYTIRELATKFKVTTRTIRYYEELGILDPQRLQSKARLFTKKDETRLRLILRGKKFGFSLEEIKEMITLFDEDRTGKKQLEKTMDFGEKKIADLKIHIEELTELKEEMENLLVDYKSKLEELEKQSKS